ncbi:EamA family transporter [Pacificitalea manganoxidans]|uniref:EamA family transporter n=1 Tax=Pacificitalea manganoxidans TaxID=1411902 RepID=A0A291M133_9RHOB|nr:DMT family transporter [Pacificitalea manganoxidans]ATI42614.1 EamA family transporter [Pacificitalea manganoxidans]MDR6307507.1 drug/metabolite transporter (DMT)-like permease [Pacificitalea manganoxidans]
MDRPMLGILMMLMFCLLAPLGDALAKILGAQLPVGELVLIRFGFQAVLMTPLVLATRGAAGMRVSRRVLGFTLLRTLFHIGGITAMFLALTYLPLADAIAIAFVMPFLLLLLGWLLLDEEVGPRRLIACFIGFLGTLLVIQPSFAAVGMAALLPLAVAVFFASFMLTTRVIAREVDAIPLQALSALMALPICGAILLAGQGSDIPLLAWEPPRAGHWPLLIALGCTGTAAHLFMTWSLRFAPAATLAPMQYLEIPIATLIGLFLFSEFPDGLALVGISIVMGSGLYIVFRERALAQKARITATPAHAAGPSSSPSNTDAAG